MRAGDGMGFTALAARKSVSEEILRGEEGEVGGWEGVFRGGEFGIFFALVSVFGFGFGLRGVLLALRFGGWGMVWCRFQGAICFRTGAVIHLCSRGVMPQSSSAMLRSCAARSKERANPSTQVTNADIRTYLGDELREGGFHSEMEDKAKMNW